MTNRVLHYEEHEVREARKNLKDVLTNAIKDEVDYAFMTMFDADKSDNYVSKYPIRYKPHKLSLLGVEVTVLCFGFYSASPDELSYADMFVIPDICFVYTSPSGVDTIKFYDDKDGYLANDCLDKLTRSVIDTGFASANMTDKSLVENFCRDFISSVFNIYEVGDLQ